ncbi:hypothetical protein ACP6PL_07735 [Dapis sp. BLCC M126]|uniref:hypothetical protein n=1 Tax=Dapis sp. BLCC M126 TaxID=3400189 RepID=UPI003CF726DA
MEGQTIADIKYDELYYAIQRIASSETVSTLLEIGSFTGQGSTEAFVTGMLKNPHQPHLFCIEAVDTLFAELAKRYEEYSQVHCYHASTVTAEQFPSPAEVMAFYKSHAQVMQEVSLDTLMRWLQEDRSYIETSGIPTHIIHTIQEEHKIDRFDVVLIDGSEFTGLIELEQVYGANIIILDDINVLKNYHSYHRLMEDPDYLRTSHNPSLRNGYAIFYRLGYLHP